MVARLAAGLLALVIAASIAGCGVTDDVDRFSAGHTAEPTGPATTEPAGPASPATSAPASAAPPLPRSGTWAELDADGPRPAAREDHTWTVDGEAGVAYLFGGRGGGETFNDLWAFDLASATWRRIEASGSAPAPRFGHEAAWLAGRGLVVTLGQAGSSFFADTWLFDPATLAWRELPAEGATPVPRYGSCSGVGPDGRLWISHGFTEDGVRFSDTLAYDFDAETWLDMTPLDGVPVERCLHACWWTGRGELVLYGGQTTGVAALGDLWRLTPGQDAASSHWRELDEPGPAARQLAAVARMGTLTVVVGGRGIDRDPLGDTWLLPDAADAFVQLPTPGDGPAARSGAALIEDATRDRLLLFGGIGGDPLDDLWSLTLD